MCKSLKKILIVDDNKTFVDTLGIALKYLFEKIEIHKLNDGIEITNSKLESIRPDAIILDISMPIIGGFKALDTLRNQNNNTPVLILSMHDEKEYLNTAIKLGANGFLLKDSDIDTIKYVLEKIHRGEKHFIKL